MDDRSGYCEWSLSDSATITNATLVLINHVTFKIVEHGFLFIEPTVNVFSAQIIIFTTCLQRVNIYL